MKLPYYENAVVAEAKITHYLLSETHEDGKHKAAFFARYGFAQSEWQSLANALLRHAAEHEVANILDTPHGKHYTVEGALPMPSGETPAIRSVWAVDEDSTTPRLITAYPLKGSKGDPS